MTAVFFDKIDELRGILGSSANLDDKWVRVQPLIGDGDVCDVFWRELSSADWLPILVENGYFKSPPSAETVEGQGTRHTPWNASKYLVRIAKAAPKPVSDVFAGIHTDNASILRDMIDAALVMPIDIGTAIIPTLCEALNEDYLWFHFKDASQLCANLATGGEGDAALKLAGSLFDPKIKPGEDAPSKRDEYWYKEGLEKVIPALVPVRPLEFCTLLCTWLNDAVKTRKSIGKQSESDRSYLWRCAIEEHPDNRDYDFTGQLVGFTRQALECAVNENSTSIDTVLKLVEKYHFLVFKRMRIHLINEFAEQILDLARQTMMTRAFFDNYKYRHEYARLLGKRFGLLLNQEQTEWFGWVDQGPSQDEVDTECSLEQAKASSEYWQFERLHWVRDHLEGARKQFYDTKLGEHGKPELADRVFRIKTTWGGAESPIPLDELKTLSFSDAVAKVTGWKPPPSGDVMLDYDGLLSTFGQYIATNPESFSKQASVLIGQDSNYIHIYLNRMADAARDCKAIDIPNILEFCDWVVQHPFKQAQTKDQKPTGVLVDEHGEYARNDVSRFIENVCKARVDKAPRYEMQDIRKSIASLLERQTHGPAKSTMIMDLSEEDIRTIDFLNLGINSPRGKAVEAALEFGRWVALHTQTGETGKEIVPDGMKAIPELKAILEWQMQPKNATFEAYCVIGVRLGLLYWIDKAWLNENIDKLFDLKQFEKEPKKACGWATWNAFLVWVHPHIEFYRVLRDQFSYAVDLGATIETEPDSYEQPFAKLGEHLMVLYGRGDLDLETDNGVVHRLITKCALPIRQHAIRFVGTSVSQAGEELPEGTAKRFAALWEAYWEAVGQDDAKQNPTASTFGWWFVSGAFDAKWSLNRLEQFVNVAPVAEPDDQIVERLKEIADVDLGQSIRILRCLVEGDEEQWRVSSWIDHGKVILEMAMAGPKEVRDDAVLLIDTLGRRGFVDLGELLHS